MIIAAEALTCQRILELTGIVYSPTFFDYKTNELATMAQPLKIFISYAHEDEPHKDMLVEQLQPLIDDEVFEVWHDRKILPSSDWEDNIEKSLHQAQIVLLLISPSFMSSDYCKGKELQFALERSKKGYTHVVPIIVRPCVWKTKQLKIDSLQALPRDAKAIVSSHWSHPDEALFEVVTELNELAEHLELKEDTMSFSDFDVSRLPNPDSDKEIYEIDKYSCDRRDQRDEFEGHLMDHEDSDFYFSFVSGDKEEQVDSFIKRIYLGILSENSNEALMMINVSDKSAVTFQFHRKLPHSIKRFQKNIIRDLHLQEDEQLNSDFTFEQVSMLSAFDSLKTLVLNVKIYSDDWLKCDHRAEFVTWLFEDFFRSSIENGCRFKVIVFFSIVFNHGSGVLASAQKRKDAIKSQMKNGIDQLRKSPLSKFVDSSYCELSELPPVPHEDLEEWFGSFYLNSLDAEKIIIQMFGEEKNHRTMAEIEQKTHPMIEEFLNRNNGI